MRNVLYDRREKIIALLNRDGMVKANELVEQYGVDTISDGQLWSEPDTAETDPLL